MQEPTEKVPLQHCVVFKHDCMLLLFMTAVKALKDTSQRGSDIRRFGSAMAAFISDYNDTYKHEGSRSAAKMSDI